MSHFPRAIIDPVTITYAATITPDAAQGSLFRCTATGNVVLADPTGGVDGQQIRVEITASGADRTLTRGGVTVTIPSWTTWPVELAYNGTTWLLAPAPLTFATTQPADHGFLAWSYDPAVSVGSTAPTAGVIQLIKVKLAAAATVNNIVVYVGTAGSTLSNCYAALLDSTGARVGLSADQSSSWQSSGPKTVALTSPYAAAAGTYVVALLTNGTTPPAFTRGTSIGIDNVGLSAPNLRFATSGSGLTSIGSSITLSGASASATAYWAALSA